MQENKYVFVCYAYDNYILSCVNSVPPPRSDETGLNLQYIS